MEETNTLEQARALGAQLTELTRRIDEKQQELDQLVSQKRNIEETLLPGIFDDLGIKEIVLQNGEKIGLKEFYVGKITAANQQAAFTWLTDNGFGGLIKKEFKIPLGTDQAEEAVELERFLTDEDLPFSLKAAVHNQTLNAFVREQVAQNPEFPKELFGAYEVRKVEFSR